MPLASTKCSSAALLGAANAASASQEKQHFVLFETTLHKDIDSLFANVRQLERALVVLCCQWVPQRKQKEGSLKTPNARNQPMTHKSLVAEAVAHIGACGLIVQQQMPHKYLNYLCTSLHNHPRCFPILRAMANNGRLFFIPVSNSAGLLDVVHSNRKEFRKLAAKFDKLDADIREIKAMLQRLLSCQEGTSQQQAASDPSSHALRAQTSRMISPLWTDVSLSPREGS